VVLKEKVGGESSFKESILACPTAVDPKFTKICVTFYSEQIPGKL